MLVCPLCQKKVAAFHPRSHIVPEWMYSECYDKKHKAIKIDLKNLKKGKVQKGIYHTIICSECEMKSQLYDRYASLILTDKSPNSPEYKAVNRLNKKDQREGKIIKYAHWTNFDFLKLQKFVYITILRTHLAMTINGKHLLVNKHFQKMLKIYESFDYDDKSYPILIMIMPEDDELRDQVSPPFIRRGGDGHYFVEFMGAGYLFKVFVSSHSKPPYVNSMMMQKNQSIYMPFVYFEELGVFKAIMKDMRKIIKSGKNK